MDTDADLIARLSSDERAFTELYRRHAEAVLGFLMRRTRDGELAADLTAEVFAELLTRPSRYRPSPDGSAREWLMTVARNKHLDTYRRGRAEDAARRRLGMRPVAMSEADRALIEALGSAVETVVAELPDEQRDAVRGRVLEDLTYDELARRAQVSPAAIRQRVSRGLAALRTRMEEK